MTENYVLPETVLGVTGVRFMNINFAFDLGLMYGSVFDFDSGTGIVPIPFLGVAFPFGHKKVK